MRTGEGKTLVAVLPSYLNALGKKVRMEYKKTIKKLKILAGLNNNNNKLWKRFVFFFLGRSPPACPLSRACTW